MPRSPRIALEPEPRPGYLADAIVDGGGEIVPLEECEAIVWAEPRNVDDLATSLRRAPQARWIQLPFAGVEDFVEHLDRDREWTCGKGVYARPVAELAVSLGLAGLRGLGDYARVDSWTSQQGHTLLGGRVTILGGGAIAQDLVELLAPWDLHVTVVRNHVQHMDGVDLVLESDRYADALPGADLVVLALALTPETDGLIGEGELALMEEHAWLVNVARGRHVVTDDLVAALADGVIGGAGLEVTEPEPLPDGHPLWTLRNCIITPHTGTTPAMAQPRLAERVRTNVRRFAHDEPLIGPVDIDAGY